MTLRAWPFVAVLATACSAAPRGSEGPSPAAPSAPIALRTPAKWLFTDHLGVLFDDADPGAQAGTRVEPAILDGARVLVDAGVIVASARHADRFTGFRTLPARLGGGTLMWSEDRIYRAPTFLDDPRPIVDIGAVSARPWLGSVVLRTPLGLFDLDPASLAIRRLAWPGIADAIALDARRAVRVDVLGRAEVTTDGGGTWTDVLATRGARVRLVREAPREREITLATTTSDELVLGANGDLQRLDRRSPRVIEAHPASPLLDAAWPESSRALPAEIVAHAIAWGAPLPGGRALVTRERGARVISLSTGLAIADVDLPIIDERLARCQAVIAGSTALACVSDHGAHVVTIDGSLASLGLDATFTPRVGGFIVGPRGRFAFDGRCGPPEPRAIDLGRGAPNASTDPGEAPKAPPTPDEAPPDDDARVCVRGSSATWFERRVTGDDARHLYRWIPGDDGTVTALIFAPREGDPEADPKPKTRLASKRPEVDRVAEGVRVIRVDPDDIALGGGAFPAVPAPSREPPYHTVDPDFWQADDGSVRGWVKLPAEGEAKVEAPAIAHGASKRMQRVTTSRGGRTAGVRIDASGRIEVLALPEGTAEVVTGGPFAIAMALREGVPAWFESTDGGATWTPVEGPPVSRLEAPSDDHAPFGCSVLGCAFGNGVVRIGWGGPRPSSPVDLTLAPAIAPKPREPSVPALRCRLDADLPWPREKAHAPTKSSKKLQKKGSAKDAAIAEGPVSMRGSATTIGDLHAHAWSVEVVPPMSPSAAPKRVAATDPALTSNKGAAVPLLTGKASAPLDLLLHVGDRRARAGGAASLVPFPISARIGIAAEIPGGSIAFLDTDHDEIWLARGPAVAPVVHLTRVADAARTRLTIAHRISGGLAVVGYAPSSGEVFAGDLDLGRAEVGRLAALARTDAIAPANTVVCASAKLTHRALIELPVDVHIEGARGDAPVDHRVTAAMLVAMGPDRLCVEGLEASIPEGRATTISAVMGKAPSASVRSGPLLVKASCALATR